MIVALQEEWFNAEPQFRIAAYGTGAARYDGGGSAEEPAQMESRVFMHSAAASFAGHMVLAAGLFFAEAHPFDYVPPGSIAVDIVSSKEIPSLEKEAEPPPTSSMDSFDIPDDKPQADTNAAIASPPSTPFHRPSVETR